MRSRALPIIIIVVIAIGIIAGAVYSQKRRSSENSGTPPTATPVASSTSATSEPGASLAPTPAPSGSPELTANPQDSQKEQAMTNTNPDLSVDSAGLSKATAVINTTKGVIKFKFYPKDAPNTVNRIIQLINQGFYNGLSFHRVVPGFVIQGGDPLGNGTGGSGQRLKAEFNPRHHVEGTVAMARAADPDSADSQFYIALGTLPHLDNSYTVFGQVIEGMDVVRKIQVGDKMTKVAIE